MCKNIYDLAKKNEDLGSIIQSAKVAFEYSIKDFWPFKQEGDKQLYRPFWDLLQSIRSIYDDFGIPSQLKINKPNHVMDISHYYYNFLVSFLTFVSYWTHLDLADAESKEIMPHMIYKPKISFERARAQQGFFVIHPYITLHSKHVYPIQDIMFGDFDSIAKHINRKHNKAAKNL